MPAVREFFVTEARDCIAGLDAVLERADGSPADANELLRLTRTLRGSALMARADRVVVVAQLLEAVARALVSRVLSWDSTVRSRVRATVDDLRALVTGDESDPVAEGRVRATLDRWPEPGVRVPGQTAPRATGPVGVAEPTTPAASPEFVMYARGEVVGIRNVLESSVRILAREPRNREPLKAILRRQRALLGAARLDALPETAEVLQGIDTIARLVARRNVAVDGDWIAFLDAAREVLAGVVISSAGAAGETAPAALVRFRSLRDGLSARFGGVESPRRATPHAETPAPRETAAIFVVESRRLLDRLDRMVREIVDATPEREAAGRREVALAMTALRDTANAYGLDHVAAAVQSNLDRLRAATPTAMLAWIGSLREVVDGVAGDPAAQPQGSGPTPDAPSDVVPIESLCYRGEAALRRALELRSRFDLLTDADPAARESVDELFDLIRLGLS